MQMTSQTSPAPVDPEIQIFLQEHHVLTLCTSDQSVPYAANCYYVFLQVDQNTPAVYSDPLFVFLSDRKTRHAQEMLHNPAVAGTVHVEPPADRAGVSQIRGVQFSGRVQPLAQADNSPQAMRARETYYTKFPYAKETPGDCWLLTVESIKMTDNSVRFGFKRYWPEEAS